LVGKGWATSSALAAEDGADFTWVWIGPHDDMSDLLNNRARFRMRLDSALLHPGVESACRRV